MESKTEEKIEECTLDSQCEVKLHYKPEQQRAAFASFRKKVVKLLFLIEEEQKGNVQLDKWFDGFIFELFSANELCDNRLIDVVNKIYGLYNKKQYKSMTHSQVKRQIMESKGILDYLIEETSKK